jgi:hypothetical protein
LLAVAGGGIGVALGVGSAYLISALGYWQILISWPATAVAFAFSAALGHLA